MTDTQETVTTQPTLTEPVRPTSTTTTTTAIPPLPPATTDLNVYINSKDATNLKR